MRRKKFNLKNFVGKNICFRYRNGKIGKGIGVYLVSYDILRVDLSNVSERWYVYPDVPIWLDNK